MLKFAAELAVIDPSFYPAVNPAHLIAFGIVMASCIPACLKFMWDVRHPPN